MKKQLVILFAIILVIASCDKDYDFDSPYTNDDQTSIDNDQGENDNQEEEGSLTLYQVNGDDITKIKDYTVASNLQSFQQDYAKHLRIQNQNKWKCSRSTTS